MQCQTPESNMWQFHQMERDVISFYVPITPMVNNLLYFHYFYDAVPLVSAGHCYANNQHSSMLQSVSWESFLPPPLHLYFFYFFVFNVPWPSFREFGILRV